MILTKPAVSLQPSSPGFPDTGTANVSGDVIANGNIQAVGSFEMGSGLIHGALYASDVHVLSIENSQGNINAVPKNWLINGNMDVCQRYGPLGSAVVAASAATPPLKAYVLDRWASVRDGTGATVTVSQQAFTIGQTAVPGEPLYYFRHAQTVAGSGGTFNYTQQWIEDVRTLAGQPATISFYAKADATRTVTALFRQNFGTGGSPSGDVTSSTTACSLTTTWQKFTASVTLGSVASKVRGSNNNDALIMELQLPLNTAMTIDIAQVQVEAGANAGAFQKKSFQEELRDCYRYYRKCFPYATVPANSISAGALVSSLPPALGGTFYTMSVSLGTALRIIPVAANAAIYNSGGGTAGQAYNFTRANSSTAISFNSTGSSETIFLFQITAFPVGWVANDLFSVGWTIDVEL
jgi:hypothetical protein